MSSSTVDGSGSPRKARLAVYGHIRRENPAKYWEAMWAATKPLSSLHRRCSSTPRPTAILARQSFLRNFHRILGIGGLKGVPHVTGRFYSAARSREDDLDRRIRLRQTAPRRYQTLNAHPVAAQPLFTRLNTLRMPPPFPGKAIPAPTTRPPTDPAVGRFIWRAPKGVSHTRAVVPSPTTIRRAFSQDGSPETSPRVTFAHPACHDRERGARCVRGG